MKKYILTIIAVLFALTVFFLKGKITHEKFDSTLWKTANLNLEDNMTLRWDMMNDLRKKYKLVGMTKNETIDLLGDPQLFKVYSIYNAMRMSPTSHILCS